MIIMKISSGICFSGTDVFNLGGYEEYEKLYPIMAIQISTIPNYKDIIPIGIRTDITNFDRSDPKASKGVYMERMTAVGPSYFYSAKAGVGTFGNSETIKLIFLSSVTW
jgi:hypothetical protein